MYAVPCRGEACRAVPCRAVPCRAVPCCAVRCRAMPRRAVPCRGVPCPGMAWRGVAWRGMSCRGVAWRGVVGVARWDFRGWMACFSACLFACLPTLCSPPRPWLLLELSGCRIAGLLSRRARRHVGRSDRRAFDFQHPTPKSQSSNPPTSQPDNRQPTNPSEPPTQQPTQSSNVRGVRGSAPWGTHTHERESYRTLGCTYATPGGFVRTLEVCPRHVRAPRGPLALASGSLRSPREGRGVRSPRPGGCVRAPRGSDVCAPWVHVRAHTGGHRMRTPGAHVRRSGGCACAAQGARTRSSG